FVFSVKEIRKSPKITTRNETQSLYNLLKDISNQTGLQFRQVNQNIHVRKRYSPIEEKEHSLQVGEFLDVVISGTVTDENGEPLPGATIAVQGTSLGTVTDLAGSYSLSVPDGATLVFSYIGYENQRITVGNQTTINVSLSEDASSLDEVVVIGYGEMKKSDLTGAVGSINSEAITRQNPVQAAKALQGQIAGVNVNKINSRPGADFTIDIRGLQSIGFSNEPLVV